MGTIKSQEIWKSEIIGFSREITVIPMHYCINTVFPQTLKLPTKTSEGENPTQRLCSEKKIYATGKMLAERAENVFPAVIWFQSNTTGSHPALLPVSSELLHLYQLYILNMNLSVGVLSYPTAKEISVLFKTDCGRIQTTIET